MESISIAINELEEDTLYALLETLRGEKDITLHNQIALDNLEAYLEL